VVFLALLLCSSTAFSNQLITSDDNSHLAEGIGIFAEAFFENALKDYHILGAAYNEMTDWMQKNQCIPTGVAYEFYLNSPEEVPESELLTKIMFPLK